MNEGSSTSLFIMYQSLIELISDRGQRISEYKELKYQSLIELISDIIKRPDKLIRQDVSISYRVNF